MCRPFILLKIICTPEFFFFFYLKEVLVFILALYSTTMITRDCVRYMGEKKRIYRDLHRGWWDLLNNNFWCKNTCTKGSLQFPRITEVPGRKRIQCIEFKYMNFKALYAWNQTWCLRTFRSECLVKNKRQSQYLTSRCPGRCNRRPPAPDDCSRCMWFDSIWVLTNPLLQTQRTTSA